MNFSVVFRKKWSFISPKHLAVLVVLFFSKLFRFNGLRACRFHPSCSEYSFQAWERFNFFKAAGFTVCRLLRCHPFSSGGYDPLPDSLGCHCEESRSDDEAI